MLEYKSLSVRNIRGSVLTPGLYRLGFPVAKDTVFFADECLLRPELLVRDLPSDSRVQCLAAGVVQIVHHKQGYWRAKDAAGVDRKRPSGGTW